MDRHPSRESGIALYLKEHLGRDRVPLLENPSQLGIIFCVDEDQARLLHRLQVRWEVIAGHDAEQLEGILDAQCVIERMKEAGTEPVITSNDDDPGGAPVNLGAQRGEAGRTPERIRSRERPRDAPWPARPS